MPNNFIVICLFMDTVKKTSQLMSDVKIPSLPARSLQPILIFRPFLSTLQY